MNSPNIKSEGSYYTPQLLADYIVYRLFDEGNYQFNDTVDILEPSVGDGIFLNAILNGNYYKDKLEGKFNKEIPYVSIDAVEIDSHVARATELKTGQYDPARGRVHVISADYLQYYLSETKKYDLIIGNPPYVRRRNMTLEQREICAEVHKSANLKDVNPKNLWTSFFAGAKESLNEKGVIAFVLPADLLQVKYAEEIREILHQDFDRVEIFTLNWIYFDDIEQDVVILICSNGHGKSDGPSFIHINSLDDLAKPKHFEDSDNSRRLTLNKWTNYVLDKKEFEFLDHIHSRIRPEPIKYYCDSGAGIVTAANDYYIVSKNVVDDFSLSDIAKPTIKKSSSMFPAVTLTNIDIKTKQEAGAEILLLDFPDKPKSDLPGNYLKYLAEGEANNIHQRYKMLLRNNWYAVPSVWSSEAFFTKRSNIYPRIIVNEAGAHVTDAFYRIRMKEDFNEKNLAFSFFNTFTFIYSELMGRYYGGGVLELTPNEFKGLPMPYVKKDISQEIKTLDERIRNAHKLTDILDYTDSVILRDSYNLSKKDIATLREIYRKLLVRRLKKSDLNI